MRKINEDINVPGMGGTPQNDHGVEISSTHLASKDPGWMHEAKELQDLTKRK